MESEPLKVLHIDPDHPDAGAIDVAAAALNRGLLVIVPTETVYGVAANPRVSGSVERIYQAKGRPSEKPIALLAHDVGLVKASGAEMGPAAGTLAAKFWPGPLTLVLRVKDEFTAFRVPGYPVTRALLERVGHLVAVTSANLSGKTAATTAQEAVEALGQCVAVALDAGPSPGRVPSTVVKVVGKTIEVLREGAISKREITLAVRENG